MTNCDWMETQNLVISFDYSWFLAKSLAYPECLIMKFHYRNSSIPQYIVSVLSIWDVCITLIQTSVLCFFLKTFSLFSGSLGRKMKSGVFWKLFYLLGSWYNLFIFFFYQFSPYFYFYQCTKFESVLGMY